MLRQWRAGRPGHPGVPGPRAHAPSPADVLTAYRRTAAPRLDAGQATQLVSAVGQWWRVATRARRGTLAVPSAAVRDVLAHLPTGGGGALPDTAGRPLAAVYLLACADEDAVPPHLPLLFRVDWRLDRLDGRVYVPNCGQLRYCVTPTGTTCLEHVVHPPRRRATWHGGSVRDTMLDGSSGTSWQTGLPVPRPRR